MRIERTKNATRNIIFGIVLKVYQIAMPFLIKIHALFGFFSFFSRFFNFIRYSCISGGTLIAASAALLTSTTVLLFGARIPDTASRSKSSIVVETVEFEWIPALSSAL